MERVGCNLSSQFNKIFGSMGKRMRDSLLEVYDKEVLRLDVNSIGDFAVMIKNSSPLANLANSAGLASLLELYLAEKILGEGPKIFNLEAAEGQIGYSRLNLEAMENIEINIGFGDYVQPYPTMVIELPENYIEGKAAYCPQMKTNHNPIFVILRHEKVKDRYVIVCGVYFFNKDFDKQLCITFLLLEEGDDTIEERLVALDLKQEYKGSEVMDKTETETAYSVVRACMNCLSISSEIGCKRIGFQNPSVYLDLNNRIQKREKRKGQLDSREQEKLESDKKELRVLPIVYSFSQEIKLWKEERKSEKVLNLEHKSGVTVRPHWRRGHRRRQNYGPKNDSKIKIILIKPVLVNAAKFGGKTSDTTVEYK